MQVLGAWCGLGCTFFPSSPVCPRGAVPSEGQRGCSSGGSDGASGSASGHRLWTWSLQAEERGKGAQALGSRQKVTQKASPPSTRVPEARWSQRFQGLFLRDGEGK